MSAKSLADLRTAARQLANYETSDFVTDTELTSRVNEAVGALYDEILKAHETYFNLPFSFTLAGGIGGNAVALPSDFYKARALDRNPGTSSEGTVDALPSYNERHIPQRISYDIDANGLTIYPAATSGAPYRLWYTPLCPVLADLATVTVAYPSTPITRTPGSDGLDTSLSLAGWFFAAGAFADPGDVGRWLGITGAANPGNNGMHLVQAVPDATDLNTSKIGLTDESFGAGVAAALYTGPVDSVSFSGSNTWVFNGADFTGVAVGSTFIVAGTRTADGTYTIAAVIDAHTVQTTGGALFETFLPGVTVTYQPAGTVNVLPIAMNIWALYIELFVAIAILDKAEQDSSSLQARLNQQIARVQALAPSRRAAPLQVPLPAHGGRFRRFWGH